MTAIATPPPLTDVDTPVRHAAALPGDTLSAELVQVVERTLREFLSAEVVAFDRADPELGRFAQTARDCVLAGGKRLRPTFAYWGWRGVAGAAASPAAAVPAFAALELLHTFALVQDDVMDASDTRRGRPAAHRILATQHARAGRTGDPGRFGRAAAILLSDLCLVWADRLLATSTVPSSALLTARRCYDTMRVETIAGQYLDVLSEGDAGGWSKRRAQWVARHKTGSYTVWRPLCFGAALTGRRVPARVTAAYTTYGGAVGEAFQYRDDLLSVYGDPAVTGKPAGEDLRSGKPTMLLLTARRLATPAQRMELERALSAPDDHDFDIDRLAHVVATTGAVNRIELMIYNRVVAARTAITNAPIDETARRTLAELAVAIALPGMTPAVPGSDDRYLGTGQR